MSYLDEEILNVLENKYLFTGLKKNIKEWSEECILKVYNRLLNVYDSEYNSGDLDYNSKKGRWHTTRYFQRMGLGHIVQKVEDLTNGTKTLKVITVLDDKVSAKYRENASKRIRAVVKQEQLIKMKEKKPCRGQENVEPDLQDANTGLNSNLPNLEEEKLLFMNKGSLLQRTPIKPPDSISLKSKISEVPLEHFQEKKSANGKFSSIRSALPGSSNYIPCGRQIPRTPRRPDIDIDSEKEHKNSLDMMHGKTGQKSNEGESHSPQSKGNYSEKCENITSSPEADLVLNNHNRVSVVPDKQDNSSLMATEFIPMEISHAQSCSYTFRHYSPSKGSKCHAAHNPMMDKVTAVEIESDGGEVAETLPPFVKNKKVVPITSVKYGERDTKENSQGATRAKDVLDEKTDTLSSPPNCSSSDKNENIPSVAKSLSEVDDTISEKTVMTQKEFLILDEKPLPITGTPDIVNEPVTIREYQKNIIPKGKQLKRTPTGPITSSEFDQDCMLVDYSVHESSNSVLEVTKIESNLDYSLQIFVKTKKEKKTECDNLTNVVVSGTDNVSLENVNMRKAIIPKQIFKTEPNTSFDKNVEEPSSIDDRSNNVNYAVKCSNEEEQNVLANDDVKEENLGPDTESIITDEKDSENQEGMQVESHSKYKVQKDFQYIKETNVMVGCSNSGNEEGSSVFEVAEKDTKTETGSLGKPPGASVELIHGEVEAHCIAEKSKTSFTSENLGLHLCMETVCNELNGDQNDSGNHITETDNAIQSSPQQSDKPNLAEEIDNLFENSFDIFPTRKQNKQLRVYSKGIQSKSNPVKEDDRKGVIRSVGKDIESNTSENEEKIIKDDLDEKNGDQEKTTGVQTLEALEEKGDCNVQVPKRQTRQLRNKSKENKQSKLNKDQQYNLENKKGIENSVARQHHDSSKNESVINNRQLRSSNISSCQVEVKKLNSKDKSTAVNVTKTQKETGSSEGGESETHIKETEQSISVEVTLGSKRKAKTSGKKISSADKAAGKINVPATNVTKTQKETGSSEGGKTETHIEEREQTISVEVPLVPKRRAKISGKKILSADNTAGKINVPATNVTKTQKETGSSEGGESETYIEEKEQSISVEVPPVPKRKVKTSGKKISSGDKTARKIYVPATNVTKTQKEGGQSELHNEEEEQSISLEAPLVTKRKVKTSGKKSSSADKTAGKVNGPATNVTKTQKETDSSEGGESEPLIEEKDKSISLKVSRVTKRKAKTCGKKISSADKTEGKVNVTKTQKELVQGEYGESKPHIEEIEQSISLEIPLVSKKKAKTSGKKTSADETAEQVDIPGTVDKSAKEECSILDSTSGRIRRTVRSNVESKENLNTAKDREIISKPRGRGLAVEGKSSQNINTCRFNKHIAKKDNQSIHAHKQIPLADITSNIKTDRKITSKSQSTKGAMKGKPCCEEDKENSCSFMEQSISETCLNQKSKKVFVSKGIVSQNTSVFCANTRQKGKSIKYSVSKAEDSMNKNVCETNRKRSYDFKNFDDGTSGVKKKRVSKHVVGKSLSCSEQSLEKLVQGEQPAESAAPSREGISRSEVQIKITHNTVGTQRKNESGGEKKVSATHRILKQKTVSKEKEDDGDDPESLLVCDISEIIATSRKGKVKRNLEDTKLSLSINGPSVAKKKMASEEVLEVEAEYGNVARNKRVLSKSKKVESKERVSRISKQSANKTVAGNTSLMKKSFPQKVNGKQIMDKNSDVPPSENVRVSRRCKTLALAAIKESLNDSDSYEIYRKSKY
ncbi:LOW QUALITY PROTEIN: serine-rich adhesin for platelets-like [Macrobrachium rosenbergii]|uniref:LOW QUALITY PROTEIN: serine-rich adhesin for platelets-like n=1 Tax=Macrobrachium rosenbergii TaxID=79674 RepID=UPI0034D4FFC0